MGRHKEWRKVAKKMRRKRIRSAAASKRDEEEKERLEKISSTPYYKAWLAEQEALEEFRQQEEKKASILAHEKWLYLETVAQEKWVKKQKLLLEEETKRKEQEALIKREWEREQEKERKEKETKELEEKRKKQQYEKLMEQMDSFIEGSGAKPEGLYTSFETNPGREPCPFFSKVGACRFRDTCSRNHVKPGISSVILIPGFYSHFSLEIGVQGEYDTDMSLEFDQSERLSHFKEFFEDVIPELEKFGPIVTFKVCSNTDPHLRGNVYVAYKSERAAAAAYKALNGRFYAGRVLNVEFVTIPSWKNAICGLQFRGRCPKGSKCNFLHVFRNPNNLYFHWDNPVEQRVKERSPDRDDWRWTPSPPVVRGDADEDNDRPRQRKKQRRRSDRADAERDRRSRRRDSPEPTGSQFTGRSEERTRSRDRFSVSSDLRDRSRDRLETHSDKRRRSEKHSDTQRTERDLSREGLGTPKDGRDRPRDRSHTPYDRQGSGCQQETTGRLERRRKQRSGSHENRKRRSRSKSDRSRHRKERSKDKTATREN